MIILYTTIPDFIHENMFGTLCIFSEIQISRSDSKHNKIVVSGCPSDSDNDNLGYKNIHFHLSGFCFISQLSIAKKMITAKSTLATDQIYPWEMANNNYLSDFIKSHDRLKAYLNLQVKHGYFKF